MRSRTAHLLGQQDFASVTNQSLEPLVCVTVTDAAPEVTTPPDDPSW
jgi:hypothetical protein